MKTKKLLSVLGVALALALVTGPAAAAISWFSPITALQDDDLDFVVDNDLPGTPGFGNISVGDRIIAAGEIRNTQGIFAGQGPNNVSPEELTFVGDVTVLAIVGGTFILGPSGAAGVLSGFAAGTTLVAWTDATPDFEPINAACGTRASCLSLAGLGGADGSALFLTFGFFGDPDELWVATPAAGGTVISTVQNGGSSTKFGDINFSQSVGINATGQELLQQPCAPFCGLGGDGLIDVTGSSDFLGGQGLVAAEWTARTDADLQLAVPEPGSLALLGLALLGLGAGKLRRKFVN